MERYTNRERTNQMGGKKGAKVKTIPGPAKGNTSGNPTSGGKQKLRKGK